MLKLLLQMENIKIYNIYNKISNLILIQINYNKLQYQQNIIYGVKISRIIFNCKFNKIKNSI